jgi:SAM-dependent methyltransferase
MRNLEHWRPTKFVTGRDGGLEGSPDPSQVNFRSRLVVACMAPHYQRAVAAYARGRLLDLGCGKVPLYAVYAPLVSQVICADWPASFHGNEHIDVAVDLTASLPFADRSYDTVLATDVLEHLPDPALFWAEVARVLRPGGHVIVGVPFMYWLHETPHDYLRHTEFSLARHCESAGLSVLRLDAYAGALAVVLDIIGKNIQRRRPAVAFQRWAMALWRSRLGQRWDAAGRATFPLGYCLVAARPTDAVAVGSAGLRVNEETRMRQSASRLRSSEN